MKFSIPRRTVDGCTLLGFALALLTLAPTTPQIWEKYVFLVGAIVYAILAIIVFLKGVSK